MIDYEVVLRAQPFEILVGKEEACFTIPETLADGISVPLHTMMTDPKWKTGHDGVPRLPEVESNTFIAFCEYVFTGDYRVRKEPVVHESTPDSPAAEEAPVPEPESHHSIDDAPNDLHLVNPPMTGEIVNFVWEPPFGTRLVKTKKKNRVTVEWDEFLGLRYDQATSGNPLDTSNIDKSGHKPLLFHAKLYIFAEMYLIQRLKDHTLQKLHSALIDFNLDDNTTGEVLEVLKYAYAETVRTDEADDMLRRLLIHYAACKVEVLTKDPAFGHLLDGCGEMGSDLVIKLTLGRIERST